MAKITFGPIVSEARNKVGGVVYSRNTYGPYSRAFIVPPYTNTSAQAAARAALTTLSQRWGSVLSDEQRAGWRSLGELYPHTDVFKQVNSRPGLQAYLRANLALASVGSSPVDTAPQNWHATDPGEITATALSGAPPTITVNAANPPAANEAVQIWVSPQQSPGANYFYRRLRLVATAAAGTAGPWNPSAGWAARLGALAFPAKLGLGIRYVNVETGATGPMRTALITVTEGEEFMIATFTLNDAQIKAIPSSRFPLIATPPVGKELILLGGRALFNTPVPYVSPGSTPQLALAFATPPWRLASQIIGNENVVTAAGPVSADIAPCSLLEGTIGDYAGILFTESGTPTGQIGLVLLDNDNDGGADYTGGDPGNTITITLVYQLINALT